MTLIEAFQLGAAVLASVGGGGAIVLAISSRVGKHWADRLLEREKGEIAEKIEGFKATLQRDTDRSAQALREKLALYKEAALPLIELIVEAHSKETLSAAELKEFEKSRLRTSALLGMFAPQTAIWAHDDLIAYTLQGLEGKQPFTWPEFRNLGLRFISEIRRDIGLHKDELIYRGAR